MDGLFNPFFHLTHRRITSNNHQHLSVICGGFKYFRIFFRWIGGSTSQLVDVKTSQLKDETSSDAGAAPQVGHKRLFVEAPFASGDFADAWEHGVDIMSIDLSTDKQIASKRGGLIWNK